MDPLIVWIVIGLLLVGVGVALWLTFRRPVTIGVEDRYAHALELWLEADRAGAARLLRQYRFDEVPQFWSVLRGDMSLVGPRPPTPDEVVQYCGSHRRRLSMRPGLTCLWQVSGRNEIAFQEWMNLDLEYIDSWSLGKDMSILLRTIPTVLLTRGAS